MASNQIMGFFKLHRRHQSRFVSFSWLLTVWRIQIRNHSSVYTFRFLIETAFFLHIYIWTEEGGVFLSVFSKQYASFTPVELIAETSGVPFSGASQFSSSAFRLSVAFHATAISAHTGVMGNSLRGSRDWDHFELLIFILHKGAGGVGLPLVNTAERSDCHWASVNSRSQAALSHTDTHMHTN